ncbi:E3 ubiquitin-protein ligase HUWE1 [Microdochium nivale]|nr:E3 ubiquitin-protein ligase HUWE1 [Microdochium nivale]
MGKITKTIQPKHKETLSPWLQQFVDNAATTPLSTLPQVLETFPSRWPFPRGDLYHWIPLLNKFDDILEQFCTAYRLGDGPQTRDFSREVLIQAGDLSEETDATPDNAKLDELGYREDGDVQLVIAILNFTQMLLDHCGNRSIYASSSSLNHLLNSTDFNLICAALHVGVELAQRYQASVKRMGIPPRQVHSALLANHYNIDLDRVQQLAQPFVKTPIIKPTSSVTFSTPSPAIKNKDKPHSSASRNSAVMYANDLCAIAKSDASEETGIEARWAGWGDIKVTYYPTSSTAQEPARPPISERSHSSSAIPATPTPLRRSSTAISSNTTPRSARQTALDDSPASTSGSPLAGHDGTASPPSQKSLEIPQSSVVSTPIFELLQRAPESMPKEANYEFLNRLRVAKALLGSHETRQLALKARLLAIQNLAYIHMENSFAEKVLRQDQDEPRRFQLIYQLAELIHPPSDGATVVPLDLQAIALSLLEAISGYPSKIPDIFSALNATVNHGILLYVIRKAVAEMKQDDAGNQWTVEDEWRENLFSLTLHITMAMAHTARSTPEIISAGLLDVLVEILNLRSNIAERTHGTLVGFLDSLVYNVQTSFQTLVAANGLEAITELVNHEVRLAETLATNGNRTPEDHRSLVVDYEIPFYQQQNLKFLLKFIHHSMSNAFAQGGNTDRLLRNLVDQSELLASIRQIVENAPRFGSLVWTNAVTILSDFLNNDPTSFAAVSEAGLVKSFLKAITGVDVLESQPTEGSQDEVEPTQTDLAEDTRPHPPPRESLQGRVMENLASSILPSTDVITTIPAVINAISLNNIGMKMVVQSRVFDSFFEVFESPNHVRVLANDADLAQNVGGLFDELARHHPALRPAIGNAVLDMVARITNLAIVKGQVGWGAQLWSASDNSKGKDTTATVSDDADVDMADAIIPASMPDSEPQQRPSSPRESISPYIFAIANFLLSYISNPSLKSLLISKGGVELLLDLSTSPSLVHDFGNTHASKHLQVCISQLIETSPIIGLPSLLKRTQAALNALKPVVQKDSQGENSFFAPVLTENPDPQLAESGTEVVKALLNAQSLIRTLFQCYPYSSRAQTITLHSVNVYDYYDRLIGSIGPLLRTVILEEMAINNCVPAHWSAKKDASSADRPSPSISGASANDALGVIIDDNGLPDVLSQAPTNGEKPPGATQSEQSSPRYRNYRTIRGLLHSLMPTAFPLLQTFGKALLPRRERDVYTRAHHVRMAESLAETILSQLSSLGPNKPSKDYQYWIIMLHTVHEMLIDRRLDTRHIERTGNHIIAPVLVAFIKHGGIDKLNELLNVFNNDLCRERTEGEDASLSRLASIGMKKILDLYTLLVNGKVVTDSVQQVNLIPRQSGSDRRLDSQVAPNLVVELRLAILPAVRKLWDSLLVEKSSTANLTTKIINILRAISEADSENHAFRSSEKNPPPPYLQPTLVPFPWSSVQTEVRQLEETGHPRDLAEEAVYRANNNTQLSPEYCTAHSLGLAGTRNPIPDVDTPPPAQSTTEATPATDEQNGDNTQMVIDQSSNFLSELRDAAILPNTAADQAPRLQPSSPTAPGSNIATPTPDAEAQATTSGTADAAEKKARPVPSRDDLDNARAEIREDLIDRCLDVIREHPDSTHEISELIRATSLKGAEDVSSRQEIGETLVNALMSFAAEEDFKPIGRSIAAYAHLLSLLLQDKDFFKATVGTLKDNVSDLLRFLELSTSPSSEELPPWIPYILLVLEILLSDDEQPAEVTWKAPTTMNDVMEPLVLPEEDLNIKNDDRKTLLESIIAILPRIGKEEALAVSVLRIFVIMTRDRDFARLVGQQVNLQRLFVMAKQLCGLGSTRLNDKRITSHILIILRHIIEDEEVLKQFMRSEIKAFFEQTRSRGTPEITNYVRTLSHVALREPKLFVQVSNELIKLPRWNPHDAGMGHRQPIALKETRPDSAKDDVAPTVRATEDLSIQDVKQSTEEKEKIGSDQSKIAVGDKRPVLENPDGVVHFLLCELQNYRAVEDSETSVNSKDNTQAENQSTTTTSKTGAQSEGEDRATDAKDKKVKPPFKSDEHPIFVYRCFLMHCLAELLQSYNRTKMEFINFKRSAPLQTNTPIKPRSTALNYLLNDLLCSSTWADVTTDSLVMKKKQATAALAQNLLVALVSKTGEKPIDRSRDKFDYDEEPDLLFVRKFVLDTTLKSYKDASFSNESFENRYAKMLALAEVMYVMMGDKEKETPLPTRSTLESPERSQAQIRRLMYEKGYLAALTASIADIDLGFPPVKRTIKYILRVLRILTSTAIQLSHSNIISTPPNEDILDDEVASATSLSDIEDDREETPDLYRNSALGLNEPGRVREGDYSEDDEEDDDEMYHHEYDDEMDYDEEEDEMRDPEEDISEDDEDEDDMAGMGPIEGLPGDLGVVEVTMDDEDEDEDDEMDEDDDEDSDDDEDDSDDMDGVEDRLEIVDEEGNPLEDDNASGWESPSDEDEDEVDGVEYGEHDEELDEPHTHDLDGEGVPRIGDIMRAIDEDFQIDDLNDRFVADEDDEDDVDEDLEDEYAYEDDYPNDPPPPNMGAPSLGWDTTFVVDNGGMFGGHPPHRHRHNVRSPLPPLPFMMGTRGDPLAALDGRGFGRVHRHDAGRTPSNEDGTNPLLRRGDAGQEGANRGFNPNLLRLGLPGSLFGAANLDNPMAFINELVSSLPLSFSRNGHALHFQITQGPRGEVREVSLPIDHHGREARPDRREHFQEPSQATSFNGESTILRWIDEVKMIFGQQHAEKSGRLVPILLSYLLPPAVQYEREQAEIRRMQEEERKKAEDEERKAREAREAEERAVRERIEAEERERAVAEAAEIAAQVEAESGSSEQAPTASTGEAMEGVETSNDSNAETQGGPPPGQPRVYTMIRGDQVDITDLGIDADYLEALPEEFREEVIAQTISTRRAQAREGPGPGEQTEVFQEFLDALPRELRMEIVQQERAEQRRREHQEARRQASTANTGQIPEAQDMDPASILMTLPPELREQVLIEQGADIMDTLPPEMAAQARRLVRPEPHTSEAAASSGRPREIISATGQTESEKNQRKAVVQMLDRSGVATLLRLMFINVKGGSLESSLKHVFKDICENRLNRSEVINTLLQILQDGTTDVDAVERSFVNLSIKAKQPKDKDPKTPQSLKRAATSTMPSQAIQPSSETSPLLIVQQCLDLLGYLAEYNIHVPSLFLTEHESNSLPLKRTLSRKGKSKDAKAHKYAINSLLALLDRDLVMESSAIMDSLSSLLSRVTFPLLALERKKKEALAAIKKLEVAPITTVDTAALSTTKSQGDEQDGKGKKEETLSGEGAADATSSSMGSQAPVNDMATTTTESDPARLAEKKLALQKKLKHLHPPVIPIQNLTLIINIFVARECSSRTFKETLSTIKNLSAVPGAMLVFGEELAKQAQMLSEKIVKHLDELLPHIQSATSGTEIQGVALAKFSPGASDQNKLLRVLTALDHLFAQKKSDGDSNDGAAMAEQMRKQDLLSELYRNATFNALWEKLSACLGAIRERENLINVATILLPLIESLMVVCKDNAQAEAQTSQGLDKEMLLTSPPPESHIASLFFTFTEEHRRILNELVRNNPSLMKGTFSNLVKNPKVLEFDNKRSWFTRSVHNKGQVPSGRIFPTLQLQVRRDQVFQDSFKSLYFKSGDEMKFGKLNIRFHGEEGVDAGGVTREWFQVLSRQMFDANYALFVPVSSDRTTFHPNKLSGINDEHLMYFKFIGRVIGKALYEGRVLDCYFSRAVYKRILGKQVSVKDMESFDPDYYKSLVWMLENDITDIITETFSVETDEFGVTRVEDLRENGRNIPVTEENKQDYVRLVVEHKLLSSVSEQMEQFLKGFHEIIPADLISIFNEQELELLISGLPDIDVDDWKGNTEYHNYSPSSQQIQWFWRALRSFDKEELAKLLQFVTGTSKVPLNGFKELEGMNGINRFNIHRDYGNKDRLPSSHTCFNQLDLPEYDSYDMLRGQLLKAITAGSEYFGFA